MGTEVERRFLLRHDGWRQLAVRIERLLDGLLARTTEAKIRVRICNGNATVAIKSRDVSGVRKEYEYGISHADAAEIIATLCGGNVVTKTRHHVEHEGFTWHIDEYHELLAGIVLAEVELPDLNAILPLPDWIGGEVTGRPEFKKINMLRERQAKADLASTKLSHLAPQTTLG